MVMIAPVVVMRIEEAVRMGFCWRGPSLPIADDTGLLLMHALATTRSSCSNKAVGTRQLAENDDPQSVVLIIGWSTIGGLGNWQIGIIFLVIGNIYSTCMVILVIDNGK